MVTCLRGLCCWIFIDKELFFDGSFIIKWLLDNNPGITFRSSDIPLHIIYIFCVSLSFAHFLSCAVFGGDPCTLLIQTHNKITTAVPTSNLRADYRRMVIKIEGDCLFWATVLITTLLITLRILSYNIKAINISDENR